jgi:hypothetical protein
MNLLQIARVEGTAKENRLPAEKFETAWEIWAVLGSFAWLRMTLSKYTTLIQTHVQ